MITLYTGTPGSGKSLHLASDLYFYLNRWKDKLVICNFEIDLTKVKHPDRFRFVPNVDLLRYGSKCLTDLADDYFQDHDMDEGSILVVLDECQLLFNTRDWRNENRLEWLGFFSQHRKYGMNIKLVTQFDEMIDKQIRALVETECMHRKLSNFGLLGWLLCTFTFSEWFISIESWYVIGHIVGRDIFRGRKKYFELYNTYKIFDKEVKQE